MQRHKIRGTTRRVCNVAAPSPVYPVEWEPLQIVTRLQVNWQSACGHWHENGLVLFGKHPSLHVNGSISTSASLEHHIHVRTLPYYDDLKSES